MVKRPTQHGAARYWQKVGEPGSNELHNVGGQRHATRQCAPHTFGPSCSARGIEHWPAQHLVGGFCVTCARNERFKFYERCALAHCSISTTLNAYNMLNTLRAFVFHCFCNRAFITRVDQHHFCLGIVKYIREFIGHPVPVHWHIGPTAVRTCLSNFKPFTLVSCHHSNGVASGKAKVSQTIHQTVHAVVEICPSNRTRFIDECRLGTTVACKITR
ncbi:unannotated protein [freshwater metagenome]|uniref:Unannotated protein n=1 Tax=freshwater metagenome TaxID=449393 RepID=A0A6J7RER6_9ZZZZ